MKKNGFTLVEMAIVLVIIGLLVGAIVIGGSLMRSAELQSIISDVKRYEDAVKLFGDKYKALPGDMSNATDFWSAVNADPTACINATPTGTQTCNGNGDGFIGDATSTPLSGNNTEALLAWRHLANGGFIAGPFSGAAVGVQLQAGVNLPASKIANAGFYLRYAGSGTAEAGTFDANYGHMLMFGANVNDETPPYNPVITSLDAREIDRKMDDGKPGTGQVLSLTNVATAQVITEHCADGATTSAAYDNSHTDIACSLIFITGF